MRIVDTKGQLCPAPLIATKKALKEAGIDESFKVVTDSNVARDNISRFLKDNKTDFEVEGNNGIWTITVRGKTGNVSLTEPEDYCTNDTPHFSKGDFIIAFTSDKMGEGDEELGRILITNFIKAVKDLDVLPKKMVFYNAGVKLGATGSPVQEHLTEIEKMGVDLLLCATCVNYYRLEEKIKIGILSNMFEIAQVMSSASNIVKP